MSNELERNVEGSSRDIIKRIIPIYIWMDSAKPRQTSVGILVSGPRFDPLFVPNINNKSYRMIQLAGDFRMLSDGVGDALQPVLSL
jgi:hypothetical protein